MTTIAILYPGTVGRALAEALAPSRHVLISSLEGRSPKTCENAERAGIRSAASLHEAVRDAGLTISVTSPVAALSIAQSYAEAIRAARSPGNARQQPLFLDANSVAPGTAVRMGEIVSEAGGRFVDGAILGPAASISKRTLLVLSGPDAPEVAELLGGSVPLKILGARIGQASAVKMAIALMTKALLALFIEMACAADKAGCLDEVLEEMRRSYAGTMEFLERNLPTFPVHAERRIVEMHEAQAWFAELDQFGTMTGAATTVLKNVADAGFVHMSGEFATLLRRMLALDPLSAKRDQTCR